MNKFQIMHAMRADAIPARKMGLWEVRKVLLGKELIEPATERWHAKARRTPPGAYTLLFRTTTATLHMGAGECVMNDFPCELRTHLGFVMRAHGRVLVTGLGLGCVLRGLNMNPNVTHIDVVERDPDVVRMVFPHLLPLWMFPGCKQTIRLHEMEAEMFAASTPDTWDCAWHDLWSDPDRDEPHLHVKHVMLMTRLAEKTKHQGAWDMPRYVKRRLTRWVG